VSENQNRRRARRQERGLRRVDDILAAAAQTFAQMGYEGATVAAIAARAEVSPGSLYQFFPNKEAIARALAERYVAEVRAIHEATLAGSAVSAALPVALDRVVDPIVAFNRAHPAFAALAGGAHASPRLAEVFRLLDSFVAERAPHLAPDRRRQIATVSLRIALALLPLTLSPDWGRGDAMVGEMKAALGGYMASVLGVPIPTDRPA
jgi:AcrR family transcriptional regulator